MPRKRESFWLPHMIPIVILFGVIFFGIMYSLQDVFYTQDELQARFVPIEIPPIAVAGENQEITVGETTILDGSGSYDPDGEIVEYEWRGLAQNPTIIDLDGANTNTASFVTDVPGNYVFTLTVTDNNDLENSDSILISVESQ
jgi:hypothetical protein